MDRPPAPRPGEPSGIEPRPHPFGPPPGRPSSVRRAADALGRVAPFLERLARRTLRWALLSLAGAVLVWWLLADRVVTGGAGAASLAVWAVVLLAPPAMLAADGVALRALARLPDRLRALPGEAAGRAGELRRLAEEVGRVRDRGRARSMLSLLRLWRPAAGSRDLLDVAAPVAFLRTSGRLRRRVADHGLPGISLGGPYRPDPAREGSHGDRSSSRPVPIPRPPCPCASGETWPSRPGTRPQGFPRSHG